MAPAHLLTTRELEVLAALLNPQAGDGLKELAYCLGITVGTLKKHLSNVRIKLRLGGVHQITLWAVAHREALHLQLPTPEQFVS